MSFKKSDFNKSPKAFFIFIFLLSLLLLAAPEFIYFIIREGSRGRLVWSEAFLALCISCLGSLVFATLLWVIFEPMRKNRNLKK